MGINFTLEDGYHFFAASPKKEALGYLKKWLKKAKKGYKLARMYPDEYIPPEEQKEDLERRVKELDKIIKWIEQVKEGDDESLWEISQYPQKLYKKK